MDAPRRLLRNETFYRSAPSQRGGMWINCGLILKPDPRQGYRDRVFDDEFILVYLLRGSGVFIDHRGRRFPVGAGSLIPHVPGLPHSCVPDGDGQWAEFFLCIPGVFYHGLLQMGHLPAGDQPLFPGISARLIKRIDELIDALRRAGPWDAPSVLAEAHTLLAEFYRPPAPRASDASDRAAIDAVCAALASDLARPVDMASLAEEHGMSYERLRKKFRALVGMPPGEFRIRRRIDRARALIAEQGHSNKAVAYALGYPDPFTFSRQFKKYVGISPSAFRASV